MVFSYLFRRKTMKATLTAMIMGAMLANYGLSGMEGSVPAGEMDTFAEEVIPVADVSGIHDREVAQGIRDVDRAVRKIPGHAGKIAKKVGDRGIVAFIEEDPELKEAGHAIGLEMGSGIRHLANALARDMVASAQK
jgi:hypothetical protein